jgi:hypothetical protein
MKSRLWVAEALSSGVPKSGSAKLHPKAARKTGSPQQPGHLRERTYFNAYAGTGSVSVFSEKGTPQEAVADN